MTMRTPASGTLEFPANGARKPRVGVLMTHPVQYYSPWFQHLASVTNLTVYYAHRQSSEEQGDAGFGRPFEWDVPLLDGYEWQWLRNVSKRPGLTRFDGCDTPEIEGIISKGRFDGFIMVGWNNKSFLQAGWAAIRSSTPLMIRLDSQLGMQPSLVKRLIKGPLYSAILPWVAHYLSPGTRSDAYLRHFKVPARRIHRLAHMVDVDRFRTSANAASATGDVGCLRSRHGASSTDVVLLFAGKLIEKKRPHLLLEAALKFRQREPTFGSSLKVWLVGDGPLRRELEAFAIAENLPVSFLGFVNQSAMPAVYAAADCLVLPSNGEETWGLVVNEAFACGVPAIVSVEAGCCPELVDDGVTGWTLRTPDADELALLLGMAVRGARQLRPEDIRARSAAGSYETGTAAILEILRRVSSTLRRDGGQQAITTFDCADPPNKGATQGLKQDAGSGPAGRQ